MTAWYALARRGPSAFQPARRQAGTHARAQATSRSSTMTVSAPPTAEEIRRVLISAFAHGRTRMARPTVLPVVDRARPQPPADLCVEDLELCSEPDHPHGQGWVPVRVMYRTQPAAAGAGPQGANAGTDALAPGVIAALTATMATTSTSRQAAFQMALEQERGASPSAPDASQPHTADGHTIHPPSDTSPQQAVGLGMTTDSAPDTQAPDAGAAPEGDSGGAQTAGDTNTAQYITDLYNTVHKEPPAGTEPTQGGAQGPEGATQGLTQQEVDVLTYQAQAYEQARAADAMLHRLNATSAASPRGGGQDAPRSGARAGDDSADVAQEDEWRAPGERARGSPDKRRATQKQQPAGAADKLPVVILLHSTGSNMNRLSSEQEAAARAGYIAVTIDCRYHGERCKVEREGQDKREVYQDALVRAWHEGVERPFLLDNLWDLSHLLDYLVTRPDVDTQRIGITGVSLGGMHAWLLAVADDRITVAAPMIGVQYFGWAVENSAWHARVASIPKVFAAAARDLGKSDVDSEVVRAVWDRLLPGMLTHYDAPWSLPTLTPRPVLIANGEKDPRCPITGVLEAFRRTQAAYCRHYGACDTGPTHAHTDSVTLSPVASSAGIGQSEVGQGPVSQTHDSTQQELDAAAAGSDQVPTSPTAAQHTAGDVTAPAAPMPLQPQQAEHGDTPSQPHTTEPHDTAPQATEPVTIDLTALYSQAEGAVQGAHQAAQRAADTAQRALNAAQAAAGELDRSAATRASPATQSALRETQDATRCVTEAMASAGLCAVAAHVTLQAVPRPGEHAMLVRVSITVSQQDSEEGQHTEGVQFAVHVCDDRPQQPAAAAAEAPASPAAEPALASPAAADPAAASSPAVAGKAPAQPDEEPPTVQQLREVISLAGQATAAAAQAEEALCRVLTCQSACERAADRAEALAVVNSRLVLYVDPSAGHEETAGMWRAIRAFLDLHLRDCPRTPQYTAGIVKHTFPVTESDTLAM